MRNYFKLLIFVISFGILAFAGITIVNANPIPTIGSISPGSKPAGSPAFTLTVNGTGFVNGSIVRWSNSNRTTTFVSSTQIRASISASDVAVQGIFNVTVFNPVNGSPPTGGSSDGWPFNVTAGSTCTPNWQCSDWGNCNNGTQSRTCTDTKNCGTTNGRPALTRSCTNTCTPSWQCTAWSACTNNSQSRTCADDNSCGTTTGRPALTRSCTPPPPPTTKGSINIDKESIGGNATFSFTSNIPNNGSFTITTSDGYNSKLIENVAPGTYSVTETVPGNWNKTQDTCGSITVTAGQTANCYIRNVKKKGTLRIVKNAANGKAEFTYEVVGPPNSYTLSIDTNATTSVSKQLYVGNYSVTEILPETNDWKFGSVSCANANGPTGNVITHGRSGVTILAGQTTTCTFNNSKRKGTLEIINNTQGGNGTFEFSVGGPEAFKVNVGPNLKHSRLVEPGDYSITETAQPGWKLDSVSCNVVTNQVAGNPSIYLDVAEDKTTTCTFTNSKIPKLTVTKELVPAADPGKFNLKVGETIKASNVGNGGTTGAIEYPAGNYTVSETAGTGTNLADYTRTFMGDCDATGKVTLAAGDNKTCTIKNEKNNPLPHVTKIEPATKTSGVAGGNAVITGSNFINGSLVTFNGPVPVSSNYVTVDSATQITIAASFINSLPRGQYAVTVTNSQPGGGTSPESVAFTVVNPKPVIIKITPDTKVKDSPGFTLTIEGSGFVSDECATGSCVQWDGNNRITKFISASKLEAQITDADLKVLGPHSVTVVNPGEQPSGAKTFTVVNPTPVITQISPDTKTINSPGFDLIVDGSGYINGNGDCAKGSCVMWNGSSKPTEFKSASKLVAKIPDADLKVEGSYPITVVNPGVPPSNARTFSVTKGGTIVLVKNTNGGDDTFNFNTSGGNGLPATIELITQNGTKSATFPVTGTGPFTISESATLGWLYPPEASCSNGANPNNNFSVPAGETVTCTFTNSKQPTLTIRKICDPANDTVNKFDLRIDGAVAGTGENVGCGGTTGPVIKSVGSHIFDEVFKTSGDFTVTYGGDPGCGPSPDGTTGKVTLAAGDNKTCTVTNTKKIPKGAIDIRVNIDIAPDDTFEFTTTGGDGFPLEFSVTTANKTKLQNFGNITPGSYSITWTPEPEWMVENASCTSGTPAGFTVSSNTKTTCTFDLKRQRKGSITIVENSPVDEPQEFCFDGDLSDANGSEIGDICLDNDNDTDANNSFTWADLNPGSYTENQLPVLDFPLLDISCSGGSSVTEHNNGVTINLQAGEDVICTFANAIGENEDGERNQGGGAATMHVNKHADGGNGTDVFHYKVYETTASNQPYREFDITANEQAGGQNQFRGFYDLEVPARKAYPYISEVVEADKGWRLDVASCADENGQPICNATTDANGNPICVDYKIAVEGETVYCSFINSKPQTPEEVCIADCNNTYDQCQTEQCAAEQDTCINDCEDQADEEEGNLEIIKRINGANDTDPPSEFHYFIWPSPLIMKLTPEGDPAEASKTERVEPDENYTIIESIPNGWKFVSAECGGKPFVQGTVNETSATISTRVIGDEKTTCTFINEKTTYETSLTINKVCVPEDDHGNFDLKLDGEDAPNGSHVPCGESAGPFPLDPGDYTVSEAAGPGTDLADYNTTYSTDCRDGNVVLAQGEQKVCTITNTNKNYVPPKKGKIKIEKEANGGNGETFEYSIEGPTSTTLLVPITGNSGTEDVEVDPGTYSIAELHQDGWKFDSASCEGNAFDPEDDGVSSVIVTADQITTCTFKNRRTSEDGTLTISKKANGGDGEF
ncbi:MAG: hypothetical protein A2730_02850, partial [Candidatus Staskawiczbacteria bacterium RIFCSPHIGHO2_01_FULL_39_25]